jgi:Zn-finger nucleic acid-binding protein
MSRPESTVRYREWPLFSEADLTVVCPVCMAGAHMCMVYGFGLTYECQRCSWWQFERGTRRRLVRLYGWPEYASHVDAEDMLE